MKNHEEGFRELQDFYNTITSENLKVIRNHKIKINTMKQEATAIRKVIDDIAQQNNTLRGPLQQK